jgi:hypothetical protein
MFKKKMKAAGIATALVAGSAALHPISSVADDLLQDSGAWLQAVGEGNLKSLDPSLEKVRLWLEMQSRWDDDWAHWYQGMFRAAVGYSLSDRATVWAGYTYLPTQQLGKASAQQQDVWPAFRYVLPTDFGTFTLRTLIESNYLPRNGDAVRVRPRQMIRFMHPLQSEPRLSLIAWDEVFVRVNTTPAGGQSGFDQNRAFAGAGWAFNPNVRAELGYMNQYLDDATHTHNTLHHLVMASLFVNW